MTNYDRDQIRKEFLDWCREMRTNAVLASAGAECGARLILIDPVEGERDITDADADFNRRSAAIIERYFVAEGISLIDPPLEHGGRSTS